MMECLLGVCISMNGGEFWQQGTYRSACVLHNTDMLIGTEDVYREMDTYEVNCCQ